MTLTQLIAEVQSLTGRTGDTVLITSARVVRFLNEAQADIAKTCPGHIDLEVSDSDAITLVAGTYSYSFASLSPTVLYPMRAFYMDGMQSQELEYVDTDEFDNEYPSPADMTPGVPTYFTRRASSIEVYPVPTSADAGKYIRLVYTKKPTDFTTSTLTATCDMSDADQGLIYYAISEALAAIGNKDSESINWRQRYAAWLETYRQEKDGLYLAEGNSLLNS